MEALRRLKKSDMQTAEEIMNKHFKECFEIHNEKVSEKYILYFHRAMREYAQQERDRKLREFKEELKQFLYNEITERRPYSASKMCEIIIEKLK